MLSYPSSIYYHNINFTVILFYFFFFQNLAFKNFFFYCTNINYCQLQTKMCIFDSNFFFKLNKQEQILLHFQNVSITYSFSLFYRLNYKIFTIF